MLTNLETYTPGYSTEASSFMAERSADTHAGFFLPYISPGDELLDCGCGPGTITLDLANAAFPGHVTGLDCETSQLAFAERLAWGREIMNARFKSGNVYDLPFRDNRFDLVFSHALLEHLAEPERALCEMARVLKAEGKIGLCVPDWDRFAIDPFPREVRNAITLYRGIQEEHGGTTDAGTKLEAWLESAGLAPLELSRHEESYEDPRRIASYLAYQLRRDGYGRAADHLVNWSGLPNARFTQSWCTAVGKKISER